MLIWAMAFWSPVSNLLYPLAYFAADRYLYAPVAGFAVLGAIAVGHLKMKALPGLSTVVSALLIVTMSILTWGQAKVWATGETLYQQAVKVSPHSGSALGGLASEYINKGELDKAEELLKRTFETGNNVKSIYLLGLIYERKGDIDKAIVQYKLFVLLNDSRYQKEVLGIRNILRFKYKINM